MERTVDVVCVTSNTGAEMLPDGEREKKVLNRVPEDLELQSVMKLVDVEVNSYKALKSKLNRIKSNECKLTIQ